MPTAMELRLQTMLRRLATRKELRIRTPRHRLRDGEPLHFEPVLQKNNPGIAHIREGKIIRASRVGGLAFCSPGKRRGKLCSRFPRVSEIVTIAIHGEEMTPTIPRNFKKMGRCTTASGVRHLARG